MSRSTLAAMISSSTVAFVVSILFAAYLVWRRCQTPPEPRLLQKSQRFIDESERPMDVWGIEGTSGPVEMREHVLAALSEMQLVSIALAPAECTSPTVLAGGAATVGAATTAGATTAGATTAVPVVEGESTDKFASSLEEIVMGEAQDATLGVVHFMKASPAAVRAGMNRGVREIEAEFEAFVAILREGATGAGSEEDGPWWATLQIAEEAYECMRYCVHEAAGSSDKCFPHSPWARDCDDHGVRLDRRTASGGAMRLTDFCELQEAQTARLEIAHVAALRIYTTPAFKVLNGPLRHPWRGTHPFPVTVSFLSDAISKLRSIAAKGPTLNATSDLWRGIKDRAVGDKFAPSGVGGTEMAPMSTTTDVKVALAYSLSQSAHALLFKLRTDSFIMRGASLRWVSAFPQEDEVLFPPLTFLRPSRKPHEVVSCANGREVTVVEVMPHLPSGL